MENFIDFLAQYKNLSNLEVTDNLKQTIEDYLQALEDALSELVQIHPPKQGDADDLFNANAPILVFLTLVGAGTGIYDEWEDFYDYEQLLHGDVYNFLINKLSSFADTSGAGKIEEALMEVEDQAKVSEIKQFIDSHPQAFVEDTVQDTSGRDLFVVVLNDGEKEWTEIIPIDIDSAKKLLENIGSKQISRAMKE